MTQGVTSTCILNHLFLKKEKKKKGTNFTNPGLQYHTDTQAFVQLLHEADQESIQF